MAEENLEKKQKEILTHQGVPRRLCIYRIRAERMLCVGSAKCIRSEEIYPNMVILQGVLGYSVKGRLKSRKISLKAIASVKKITTLIS